MKSSIILANLDDMVFEGRERRYGAYELRQKYTRRLGFALGMVSLAFLLSAFMPSVLGDKSADLGVKHKLDPVEVEILPPIKAPEEEIIIPPKPEPPKIDIKTKAFLIPEPKKAEEVEDTEEVPEMKELEKANNLGLKDVEGEDGIDLSFLEDGEGDDVPVVIEEEKDPDPGIFVPGVEEPQPINLQEIAKQVEIPEILRSIGENGRVVFRVLVDKEGNYKRHLVLKKTHPMWVTAIEEHLAKVKFTPAVQGGKPIPFWVNIPFKINLID